MNRGSERYSHELVELGNQAWILNCALAELYRFEALLGDDAGAAPLLAQGRRELLEPACARLRTRLQALMVKWTRRMAEQAGETIAVAERPWGVQVALPEALRGQLRGELTEHLTEDAINERAATAPEQFFVAYPAADNDARYSLWRFEGADLSCSKLWWSWWLAGELPLCRQAALGDNLWLIDGCGAAWRDQLAGAASC